LWIVPAKAAGTWKMPDGELTLKQIYQTFSGTLKGTLGSTLVAGRLRGENIFFAGGKTQFTGRLDGNVIDGIARTAGKDTPFRATRMGN
jgi:hypothetical protein